MCAKGPQRVNQRNIRSASKSVGWLYTQFSSHIITTSTPWYGTIAGHSRRQISRWHKFGGHENRSTFHRQPNTKNSWHHPPRYRAAENDLRFIIENLGCVRIDTNPLVHGGYVYCQKTTQLATVGQQCRIARKSRPLVYGF